MSESETHLLFKWGGPSGIVLRCGSIDDISKDDNVAIQSDNVTCPRCLEALEKARAETPAEDTK